MCDPDHRASDILKQATDEGDVQEAIKRLAEWLAEVQKWIDELDEEDENTRQYYVQAAEACDDLRLTLDDDIKRDVLERAAELLRERANE